MTQNQILYHRLQEEKRHNQMSEAHQGVSAGAQQLQALTRQRELDEQRRANLYRENLDRWYREADIILRQYQLPAQYASAAGNMIGNIAKWFG